MKNSGLGLIETKLLNVAVTKTLEENTGDSEIIALGVSVIIPLTLGVENSVKDWDDEGVISCGEGVVQSGYEGDIKGDELNKTVLVAANLVNV